jgi:radical SAM superfamily enzyme with C-terminal helix-hairpin-helix motif
MLIAILDGYIDEPACLGVPPYISPHVRYLAGAISSSGSDYFYLTIDEYRKGSTKVKQLEQCNILIVVAGAIVPGKYLGGSPISKREAISIAGEFTGISILGGPAGQFGFFDDKAGKAPKFKQEMFNHQCPGDIDACFFDFINHSEFTDRRRTLAEQNTWALQGAPVVQSHPNYPDLLLAEIESYRGCTRYHTGGCSFCIEPEYGQPYFRDQIDIISEVKKLHKAGVNNFRLGGQSCIYSYKSKGIGSLPNPQPNPPELEKLFKGLRRVIGPDGLLHVDNANPAVLADYIVQSGKITKTLVKYCTSGNVLAFGMESADPTVIKSNNLNSTPEQVMEAIELVNEYGQRRGSTGLPALLPGLNFIAGLKGERRETFQLNLEFLKKVMERNLLLRRINLRQVAMTRAKFSPTKFRKEFQRFKTKVREEIDRPMLEKLVPKGTLLHDVFTETHDGKLTFGRQLGTYPILVGIPYELPLGIKLDIHVLSYGFRSLTGVEYPFPINHASLHQLQALPGLGARRAARIIRARPLRGREELLNSLDDREVAEGLLKLVTFNKSRKR